jgi:uncharacterized protein YjbI with pentapeptide repeats
MVSTVATTGAINNKLGGGNGPYPTTSQANNPKNASPEIRNKFKNLTTVESAIISKCFDGSAIYFGRDGTKWDFTIPENLKLLKAAIKSGIPIDIENGNLTGVDLSGAQINSLSLRHCNCQELKLDRARIIKNLTLDDGTNLAKSSFSNLRHDEGASIEIGVVDLKKSNWSGANLSYSDIRVNSLNGANLSNTYLSGAKFYFDGNDLSINIPPNFNEAFTKPGEPLIIGVRWNARDTDEENVKKFVQFFKGIHKVDLKVIKFSPPGAPE